MCKMVYMSRLQTDIWKIRIIITDHIDLTMIQMNRWRNKQMVKIIMHGCNGRMGQVITGIAANDPDAEIVAGIDVVDNRDNGYPVFTDIEIGRAHV